MSEKRGAVPVWLAMAIGALLPFTVMKVAAIVDLNQPARVPLELVEWQCTAEARATLIATEKPLWTWTRVRECAQWTRNDLADKQKRRSGRKV
jgi:hypothetical protein